MLHAAVGFMAVKVGSRAGSPQAPQSLPPRLASWFWDKPELVAFGKAQ